VVFAHFSREIQGSARVLLADLVMEGTRVWRVIGASSAVKARGEDPGMLAAVVPWVVGIPLVVEAGFLMAAVVVRIAEGALVGEIPVVGENEEGKYLIFRLRNKATT